MRIFLTPLDRREFIFSPFLGFEVSDAKEIKECIVKHCFKNGESIINRGLKISIYPDAMAKEIKDRGNKQCKNSGFVDLFSIAFLMKKYKPIEFYTLMHNTYKGEAHKHYIILNQSNIKPMDCTFIELLQQLL